MSVIKKYWVTIVLGILVIVSGWYALEHSGSRDQIVYSEHLDDVCANVNGEKITFRQASYYVAFEELKVEEQAYVYDADNINKYWNAHVDGKFIRVEARESVESMIVHDEIFYQMAKAEGIELSDEERIAFENSVMDFLYDIEDYDGLDDMGVTEEDIVATMEKAALAEKYQNIYAELQGAKVEEYDFSGEKYEKLLEKNEYDITDELWEKVPFGNVILEH